MLSKIALQAQTKVAQTAQDAILGLGAGLLLFVGIGFLNAALWILLESVAGAFVAAFTIGAIYFGTGLILIAVLSARSRARKRRARERAILAAAQAKAAPSNIVGEVILAFVGAMRAGQNSRRG